MLFLLILVLILILLLLLLLSGRPPPASRTVTRMPHIPVDSVTRRRPIMFRWPVAWLLLLSALSPAAPAPKDRPAVDPDLVGDWVLKAVSQGGVEVHRHYIPAHTEFSAGGERYGRNRNGIIVSTERYSADRGRT